MIDLSSDTAARPTDHMKRHMWSAEAGDDARHENPTVRQLEGRVARLTGKEAALFLPTGVMCNVIGIFLHCSAGDEVILHANSHPVTSENAGPAVHSRVTVRTLDGARGTFTGKQVADCVAATGWHGPRTRLVSVENTHNRCGGTVWQLHEVEDVCMTARALGLATHLDGARLLHAVVASGVPASSYCAPFDSVWIDLAKGLACPAGAVLAGSGEFVAEARRARHLFGGAMHHVGMLAGAGVYALDHHVDRLAEDHALARELAAALDALPDVHVANPVPETNIVHFEPCVPSVTRFAQQVEAHGVRFMELGGRTLRAVTHLDARPADIPEVVVAVKRSLDRGAGCPC